MRDRRKSGRLRCCALSSRIGEVTNVSAGGLQVRGWGRLPNMRRRPELLELELVGIDGRAEMKVELVWVKRRWFGRFEAGFRFVEMTAEQSRRLWELVQTASKRPDSRFIISSDAEAA